MLDRERNIQMSNQLSRINRKKKKSNKKLKVFLTVFLALFLAVGGFVGYNYMKFQQALDKMSDTDDNELIAEEKLPHVEPFSVLLMGVDERENDVGRTDTMIVVTVNPDLGTMKMLSIPRDSRVEIVGNGTVEKINHAYARGGIPMTIDTVEKALNIPIDFYVSVNMEGFLSIIDELGGVEIENDMDLQHQGYTFPKGTVNLTGEEALVFSRIRYEDPRGDFGRQIRQKQLIEALLNKAKNPSILLKVDDIFEVLGDNVHMNFTKSQIMNMQKLYSKLDRNIEQLSFEKGVGSRIDGYWYYVLDEEEVATISEELNNHLSGVKLAVKENALTEG